MTREEMWNKQYQLLIEYKNETGSLKLPATSKLYQWVKQQIYAYREGKLSLEHQVKLKDIGVVLDKDDTESLQIYEEIEKRLKAYGVYKLTRPQQNFLLSQKKKLNKNTLTIEEKAFYERVSNLIENSDSVLIKPKNLNLSHRPKHTLKSHIRIDLQKETPTNPDVIDMLSLDEKSVNVRNGISDTYRDMMSLKSKNYSNK